MPQDMIDLEAELRGGLADAANLIPISADPLDAYARRTRRRDPGRRRIVVGISVAAIAAATAVIVVGAVALSSGSGSNKASLTSPPAQRSLILRPTRHLSPAELAASVNVLRLRLDAAGIADATLTTSRGRSILMQVPAASAATAIALTTTEGVLRFRQVMAIATNPANPSLGSQVVATKGPIESPTLTKGFLAVYNQLNCGLSTSRQATLGNDKPSDYLIACGTAADGYTKYLLAPVAVEGAAVRHATTQTESGDAKQWLVAITFDRRGSKAWLRVTRQAAATDRGQPPAAPCGPPKGCNGVATVFDGVVLSAPYISTLDGIAGGKMQVTGFSDRHAARLFADEVMSGALPSRFTVRAVAPTH
jgi:preprotein translocase subunit SecD